jgi:hypothetical protein
MSALVMGMDTVGESLVVGRGHRGRVRRVPTPKWSRNASMQGVSTPQEEMDFVPFSTATLDATGGALTNFAFNLTSNPQRPFRGERFVFTAVNITDGTDVLDSINIISPIFVGMVNVGSAFGQIPLRVFANNSFGVRVSIPASGQGTIITLSLVALSVVNAKKYVVSGALIGRAVR